MVSLHFLQQSNSKRKLASRVFTGMFHLNPLAIRTIFRWNISKELGVGLDPPTSFCYFFSSPSKHYFKKLT